MLKYADVQADDTEEAVVYMPEYMQDLTRLIQSWQRKENGNRYHVYRKTKNNVFQKKLLLLSKCLNSPVLSCSYVCKRSSDRTANSGTYKDGVW